MVEGQAGPEHKVMKHVPFQEHSVQNLQLLPASSTIDCSVKSKLFSMTFPGFPLFAHRLPFEFHLLLVALIESLLWLNRTSHYLLNHPYIFFLIHFA